MSIVARLYVGPMKQFNTGSLPSLEKKTNLKSNDKQRFK